MDTASGLKKPQERMAGNTEWRSTGTLTTPQEMGRNTENAGLGNLRSQETTSKKLSLTLIDQPREKGWPDQSVHSD